MCRVARNRPLPIAAAYCPSGPTRHTGFIDIINKSDLFTSRCFKGVLSRGRGAAPNNRLGRLSNGRKSMIDDREKIRNANTSLDAREEENARTGYIPLVVRFPRAVLPALHLITKGGAHRPILALFNDRVTWKAIQHWDSRRVPLPSWARDIILQHLDAIITRAEWHRARIKKEGHP